MSDETQFELTEDEAYKLGHDDGYAEGREDGRAGRTAELAPALEAALARAEAAEAVIAAAKTEAESWHTYDTHDIGGAFPESVRDLLLEILAATPQTVLAERDRKNRREGWDEGYMARDDATVDIYGDIDNVSGNPYTEKEQSK